MSDMFYKAFEDRYRGSRETIKARLAAYTPFLQPLLASGAPARALDLGCGRGEWLELTGELGFEAIGVDLDDGMLSACRERGLNVQTGDALAALRATPDDSLALVSAFHLVEHIPFDAVRELIAEARRVLRPGGLLIMETPNPENLVVGASSFYRDPSHLRPLPPELLDFATDFAGFARHRIVRLQEPAEVHSVPVLGLQHVFDGVSPDYAVVAQKAAPAALAASFDAAFDAPFGIALNQLASRYDLQAATQRGALDTAQSLAAQAHTQLDAVRASVAELGDHVARALSQEARIAASEARLLEYEARLAAAEAQAAKLDAVLASTSWKITRPLRHAGNLVIELRALLHRLRARIQPKRRARQAVRIVGQAVLRNPAAKRHARALLARFPGLQARLREAMYQAPVNPGAPPPPSQQPGDLSPRAQRAYAALKQAQQELEN
ncbi:MAG: class I SAM-dependent methyltransferase [Gammaproteobacteria bacterium]